MKGASPRAMPAAKASAPGLGDAPARLPSTPPVLRLRRLTIYRGRTTILRDVDWTVERGQHWVMLGANGSGKTSLLAALTGYLMPSAGEVELLGERYGESDWPRLRRRIGLVSSALRQLVHEEEPALEVVIGGRYAAIDVRDEPRPADVRAARRLLHLVDCSGLGTRPWAFLSQGERQRVLIARALMARPELLILDEPCAGLDPVGRERFLGFLEQLGRQSVPSLVLVTHHVEEIVGVFRHALVLKAGGVLARGRTAEVVNSRSLSEAFGAELQVRRKAGGFQLRLLGTRRRGPSARREPASAFAWSGYAAKRGRGSAPVTGARTRRARPS